MSFAVEGLLGLITDDFCCHEFKEHTSLVTTPTRYAEKSNMMDVFFLTSSFVMLGRSKFIELKYARAFN